MVKLMSEHPSDPEHPWRLVLYSDEVVPGNVIAHDNQRKVWVMYWSLLEFGPLLLSREESWLTVLVKRSVDVAKVEAGISQVFAGVIKLFFGALTTDMSLGGIVLKHNDSQWRLFVRMAMVVQDGGAHKFVWHCKGDSGTRMCMFCRNLVSQKSDLVDEDDGDELLTCSVIHDRDLDFATDEDIKDTCRRLAACQHTLSREHFLLRQQAVGFTYQPYGMLWDTSLDTIVQPISQYVHDWMHACFVKGVFNTIFFRLLVALQGAMDIYSHLAGYVATWEWPRGVAGSSHFARLFSDKCKESNRRAKTFKCSASEGLSLYALIAVWLMAVPLAAGVCVSECKAFLALSDVLDLLSSVAWGNVTPIALKAAVAMFLQACLAAGWARFMHSKFHWLIHFPYHLMRFGFLPTCWVHERKHRVAKRYATDIQNTQHFEESLISEMTCHHFSQMSEPDAFKTEVGLVKPVQASPKLLHSFSQMLGFSVPAECCFTSFEARLLHGGTCAKKDIVLVMCGDGQSFLCGEVWLHAELFSVPWSLVSLWQLISYDPAAWTAQWQVSDTPCMVPTKDIMMPVVYTVLKGSRVKTIIPWNMRLFKPYKS